MYVVHISCNIVIFKLKKIMQFCIHCGNIVTPFNRKKNLAHLFLHHATILYTQEDIYESQILWENNNVELPFLMLFFTSNWPFISRLLYKGEAHIIVCIGLHYIHFTNFLQCYRGSSNSMHIAYSYTVGQKI